MPPASTSKRSKTSRFPVARIKKIMQMDEDVGKLASATPVMISKSLECFMQLLLDQAVAEARAKGSKKVTAHHLKHTVTQTPSFDFLLPIVAKIPDPVITDLPSGGGGGPASSAAGPSRARKPTSQAAGDGSAATPRAGPGRKRKATGAGDVKVELESVHQPPRPAQLPQTPQHNGHSGSGRASVKYDPEGPHEIYSVAPTHGFDPVHSIVGPSRRPEEDEVPQPVPGRRAVKEEEDYDEDDNDEDEDEEMGARTDSAGMANTSSIGTAAPSMPSIGTWKKDMSGGGGSGEGGRGMFDDYEDDEDDY